MTNSIQTYGSNDEINTMAGRFRVAVKGGDKLTNNEAVALAQVAKVTNLNPFIGEIWGIPGKGTMIGIAGARRLFAEQTDGFVEILPCSPEEAGATEKDVVVAFKCIAHDSVKIAAYQRMLTETITTMRAAGSADPFGDAKEICGPRPQWVGYGYSTHSETSRMNKTQLARKRAEADALKKCIVVPFGVDVANYDNAVEYIDAEAHDVEMTIEQARAVKTPKGTPFGGLNHDQLQQIVNSPNATSEQKQAALLILAEA